MYNVKITKNIRNYGKENEISNVINIVYISIMSIIRKGIVQFRRILNKDLLYRSKEKYILQKEIYIIISLEI